jgi:hypothetical protein
MTMEEVTHDDNLRRAFTEVARNRGAAGPDGRSIDEVRAHLDELRPVLRRHLVAGTYRRNDSGENQGSLNVEFRITAPDAEQSTLDCSVPRKPITFLASQAYRSCRPFPRRQNLFQFDDLTLDQRKRYPRSLVLKVLPPSTIRQ